MNKEEFKELANKTIDDVAAKIDQLKVKKEKVSESAKSKYDEAIKMLEAKKAELEAKYVQLKNASEHKWEEVKEAFSSAADSFKEGASKIASLFS